MPTTVHRFAAFTFAVSTALACGPELGDCAQLDFEVELAIPGLNQICDVNFARSGAIRVLAGAEQPILLELSPDGAWLRSWVLPSANPSKLARCMSMSVTPDGGAWMLTGHGLFDESNFALHRLRPDGTIVSANVPTADINWLRTQATEDGDVALAGYQWVRGRSHGIVARFDADAIERARWTAPTDLGAALDLAPAPDGGVAVLAKQASIDFGDAHLLHLDAGLLARADDRVIGGIGMYPDIADIVGDGEGVLVAARTPSGAYVERRDGRGVLQWRSEGTPRSGRLGPRLAAGPSGSVVVIIPTDSEGTATGIEVVAHGRDGERTCSWVRDDLEPHSVAVSPAVASTFTLAAAVNTAEASGRRLWVATLTVE